MQLEHFPLKIKKLRTGMFSHQESLWLQLGQEEPGVTIERPSGILKMQTFRKLPMHRPEIKTRQADKCIVPKRSRTDGILIGLFREGLELDDPFLDHV